MRHLAILAATVLGHLPLSVLATDPTLVAAVADGLPGLPPDVGIASFGPARLNSEGEVSFLADLEGPDIGFFSRSSAWTDAGGSDLRLVARSTETAPGTDDTFRVIRSLSTNAAGQGLLQSTTQSGAGIWLDTPGSGLDRVVYTGDQAPGLPPGTSFGGPGTLDVVSEITDDGYFAFQSDLGFSNTDTGLWAGRAQSGLGGIDLIATTGSPAPGAGADATYTVIGPSFSVDQTNAVTFKANYNSDTNGVGNGVWKAQEGEAPRPLVIAGDNAPGTAGGSIDFVGTLHPVTDSGSVVIEAGIEGGAGPSIGVFSIDEAGLIEKVALASEEAPGAPEGTTFLNSGAAFSELHALADGGAAFIGLVEGPNLPLGFARGVWSNVSGDLDVVALEGMPAPGIELGGATFSFDLIEGPLVANPAGQVAFSAFWLADQGLDGIWGTDADGDLALIARELESVQIETVDGVVDATITGLTGPSAMDSEGVVTFPATLRYESPGGDTVRTAAILKSDRVAASLTSLPGDANGDGVVDLIDLDILGTNFGTASGATVAEGDFSGDGAVDLIDLDILGTNFGATSAEAVPEPTAFALATMLAASTIGVRRRVFRGVSPDGRSRSRRAA